MKKLSAQEISDLVNKLSNQELMSIEMRFRYAAHDEYPDLLSFVRWCVACKENNIEEKNNILIEIEQHKNHD